MLRYLTAGESHGPMLTVIIEGLPAGLAVDEEYVNRQLARRQGGYGRGVRMKIESDRVRFTGGLRGGKTLGSPLSIQIVNRDWENWGDVMDPGASARLDQRVVTRPRPGHADLAGAQKYDHCDIRNVLERSSARETAARVAAGSVARILLSGLGIEVFGRVISIGSVKAPESVFNPKTEIGATLASEVYCADAEASGAMMREIDRARENGDSLGGVFEIICCGVPPGLGSYVHWDRKLDGRLAGALMSVQAVKGVEIGAGFRAASLLGSQVHDEIFYEKGRGFYRMTNSAGGIEGGMSNGEPIVVRAAMKPIPTLYKPLSSVDFFTKEPFKASVERSDVCAVPAACVVGEAVVAWELAVCCMEKFGGDTTSDILASFNHYCERIKGL